MYCDAFHIQTVPGQSGAGTENSSRPGPKSSPSTTMRPSATTSDLLSKTRGRFVEEIRGCGTFAIHFVDCTVAGPLYSYLPEESLRITLLVSQSLKSLGFGYNLSHCLRQGQPPQNPEIDPSSIPSSPSSLALALSPALSRLVVSQLSLNGFAGAFGCSRLLRSSLHFV